VATNSQPKKRVLTEAQRAKRRQRNQNRRARARSGRTTGTSAAAVAADWLVPGGSKAETGLKRMTRMKLAQGERMTAQGVSFLKCAFAPPDFAASDLAGVPDDFHGVSLIKKHRSISSYNLPADTDLYILLLPTPGVSYWYTTVAAGTNILYNTPFYAVNYSDFATLFGTQAGQTADIVTKFRFVSNHIECIPTVNQMNWTGNIQAFRFPCATTSRNSASDVDTLTVTGLQALLSTNSLQYTGSFNMGVYAAAYNAGTKFDFQQIAEGRGAVPNSIATSGDFGQLNPNPGSSTYGFTGLDEQFDSLCVKFSGIGANTLDSMIIKTWACVEYQVLPGNLLYEFASISPTDPLAMRIYREVVANLPVGVAFYENENFWQRVLRIIRQVSGGLSLIPGPYGAIAGGVNAVSSGIEALVM